jgi:hypothetical protein
VIGKSSKGFKSRILRGLEAKTKIIRGDMVTDEIA